MSKAPDEMTPAELAAAAAIDDEKAAADSIRRLRGYVANFLEIPEGMLEQIRFISTPGTGKTFNYTLHKDRTPKPIVCVCCPPKEGK